MHGGARLARFAIRTGRCSIARAMHSTLSRTGKSRARAAISGGSRRFEERTQPTQLAAQIVHQGIQGFERKRFMLIASPAQYDRIGIAARTTVSAKAPRLWICRTRPGRPVPPPAAIRREADSQAWSIRDSSVFATNEFAWRLWLWAAASPLSPNHRKTSCAPGRGTGLPGDKPPYTELARLRWALQAKSKQVVWGRLKASLTGLPQLCP